MNAAARAMKGTISIIAMDSTWEHGSLLCVATGWFPAPFATGLPSAATGTGRGTAGAAADVDSEERRADPEGSDADLVDALVSMRSGKSRAKTGLALLKSRDCAAICTLVACGRFRDPIDWPFSNMKLSRPVSMLATDHIGFQVSGW
jgi:hypothetical protein